MTTDATGGYRDALRVGEFRAVFAAYLVSMLGDVVAAAALTVLVYQRTGSPLLAALTFTAAFVPYLFGGALLSGLVDRHPPRRVLVGCDLAAGGLVAVMTLPGLPVGALLGLLGVVSLLAPVSGGARGALLPRLLPAAAYVPGRSLLRLVSQGAQVLGNGVAAGLLAALPPRGALVADAASFLGSALLLRFGLRARPLPVRAPLARSLAADSLHGAREVLRQPAVRRVLLFGWLVPLLAVAPEALAAPYVGELGLPASAVGWWLVALPVGSIAGEVAAVTLLSPRLRRRLVRPLAVVVFAPLLMFVTRPPFGVALGLLVASGLGTAWTLGLSVLELDVTPEPLRGRMFAVSSAGLMTLQGTGFAAAGALAELIPPYRVIAGAGVLGLVVVAVLRLPWRGVDSWRTPTRSHSS